VCVFCVGRNIKEEHLVDLCVDGGHNVLGETGRKGKRIGTIWSCCEEGNEPLVSVKC
jgi:predicted NUDIX family NTP pyrophosphohydrolase